MKNLLINKKRGNAIKNDKEMRKHRISSVFLWMLALGVLTGMGSTVCASENEDSVSYVYHKHVGSSESEGGCYTQPVYHVHEGTEESGGSCYETVVYHQHAGDEVAGGDCYENPVYHEHSSDECYFTRHVHGDDCYSYISSSEYGCEVVDWWDTPEDDYEGADYKYYEMSCGQTIHGTSAWHQHKELDCNGTGGSSESVLSCSIAEGTLEGYEFSCSKTEETVDGYALSCLKTENTIELYERNCGKEEDIVYGKITVTKSLSGDGYSAYLSAKFEELNGGGVQLSDSGFSWFDSDGNNIGNGESITVSKNGTYRVAADVTGEGSNGEGLTASVTVNDIKDYVEETPEEISGDLPDDGSGESNKEGGNEAQVGRDDEDYQSKEDAGSLEEEMVLIPVPTEVPVLLETAPIVIEAESVKGKDAETDKEESDEAEAVTMGRVEEETPEEAKATATPALRKQTVTVKMEERKSDREELPRIQTIEEKKTFFDSPVVKVITVTAGTFATIVGLFALCYLFRWSVAVYNDDGKGKLTYLGRAMVQNKEEGYTAVITDEMVQRAVTNRYCLKTGLFRFGRGEEELLIEKQSKRISHVIEKEIYVVI